MLVKNINNFDKRMPPNYSYRINPNTFGSLKNGRNFSIGSGYRFGFNGKEKDEEILNDAYDFGARIYDGRLGRWMSVDPHMRRYSSISPFIFSLNSPQLFNDPDGKDARVTIQKNPEGGGKIIIASTIYITGVAANEFNANTYTKRAAEKFKSGTYTNETGEKFEIEFEIKYEYVSDKSKISLKEGDNILEYNNNEMTSQVSGNYTADVNEEGEINNVRRFTGNNGEISKDDAIGTTYGPTLHETFHFLGLSDRYIIDESGKSIPDEGFVEDIMGDGHFGRKINQVHYNNFGQTYTGKDAGEYILKERVDTKSTDGSLKGGSSDGQRPIPYEAEK